jgi:hypothetical protein
MIGKRELHPLQTNQFRDVTVWSTSPQNQNLPQDQRDIGNISAIVSELPKCITNRFPGELFLLLWRGTEDGFAVPAFHNQCDRHSNTVTLILNKNGFIVGRFQPLSWETGKWNVSFTGDNRKKTDESRKSFLFSIKGPTISRPVTMLWKGEQLGPSFGDIVVCDQCNIVKSSRSVIGITYRNGVFGVDGEVLMTGAEDCVGAVIEVFEICE